MNNTETTIELPVDEVFYKFYMMNELFTVEDYADGYAVFNEGAFVGEIADKDDHGAAYDIARQYMNKRRYG